MLELHRTAFHEPLESLIPSRCIARTALFHRSDDGSVGYARRSLVIHLIACVILALAMLPLRVTAEVWVGYAGNEIGPHPAPNEVAQEDAASGPNLNLPVCYWDESSGWADVDTNTQRKFAFYGLTQASDGSCYSSLISTGYRCKDGSNPEQAPWAQDPSNGCGVGPPGTEANETKNAGDPCTEKVCNPIHVGTGNKYQREQDYRGTGAFPLQLDRYYNSVAGVEVRNIGEQWRHTYDRTVVLNVDIATVNRADGKALQFKDIGGNWFGDPDVAARLKRLTDGGGNPTGWQYIDVNDATETYDNDGKLLSIASRSGFTQTLAYDASNRLEQVAGPFGRTLTFTYDGNDRIASMTDPAGAVYQYAYDGQGRLTSVIYPDETPGTQADNPTRIYHYENGIYPNALTGITDENGKRYVTWGYDAQGRTASSTHADGADDMSLTYNGDGTTTLIDALGTSRTFAFDISHGRVRVANVTGGPCGTGCSVYFEDQTYDLNGFPSSRTNFNGTVTNFIHDARGLETSRTEAVGTAEERTITTRWDAVFRLPILVTEPGKTTAFTYDAQGRLLTRIETDTVSGSTRTVKNTYNGQGLLATRDGPRTDVSDVTIFTYDAQGNLTATTNALGQTTRITAHDAHGRPLTLEDANGAISTLSYDARGRLISRDVVGSLTSFEYDGVGNVSKTILPDGSFLLTEYDDAHRLVAIEDNLGNRTEFTLDAAGNRTAETVRDPSSTITRTRSRVYDALNRLIQDIGGGGQETNFEYDVQGNQTAVIDGNDSRTESEYDVLNRLAKSIDPDLGETTFGYDARDNLVSATDAEGLTTTYTYDGLDNLVTQSSPDTGVTQYTYDNAGNRVTQTDARGVLAQYAYDELNRLTSIRYPSAEIDITFSYDWGTNGIGRLTGMTDESGSTGFAYDNRGNLTSETRIIDGVAYTTRYTYDLADRILSITYPSGHEVAYGRDTLGRVASVDVDVGPAVDSIVSAINYLPFGPMKGLTFGNGLVMSRTFDLDYRLATQVAGSVQDFTLAYDAANNITAITNGLDPARSQSFVYDTLDRLAQADGVYGTKDYTYDGIGNRTTFSDAAGLDTYYYGATSHHLEAIAGPGATTFTYDAAGNTVAKGALTFAYDDTNRMNEALVSGVVVGEYVYNGKGERVKKTAGGTTTVFTYDAQGQLIAESDTDGTVKKEYLYLAGQPIAVLVPEVGSSQPAAIIDPVPNATLTSDTVTFNWNSVPGATLYELKVGYGAGASEVFAATFDSSTISATVSGIPLAGGTIHVQLATNFGTHWASRQYGYGTADVLAPAEISDPVPGATLETDTATFVWGAVPGAIEYSFKASTAAGGHVHSLEVVDATTTSMAVTGIPTTGDPLHVELGTNFGTGFKRREYTYGTGNIIILQVGGTNTGQYGHNYGSSEHYTELKAIFTGTTEDLTFQVTGYDIDYTDELALYLNGSLLGHLTKGPNNGLNGGDFFVIPAASQLSGTNELRFEEKTAGWIWGVTNLLLSDQPPPLEITTTALSDATDGEAYSASLQATGGIAPYTWSIAAGALPAGLSLAADGTLSGTPTEQGSFDFTAQVTDDVGTAVDQALTLLSVGTSGTVEVSLAVGVTETGQYGWKWGSNEHKTKLYANFTGTAGDLTFNVTGYDIDYADEISVYLNGNLLGYLTVGPNNGFNAGDSIAIPAASQLPGVNLIRFKQKTSGWKWGVTELLLEP